MRHRDRVVFQADSFWRRTLEFLKCSYLLLLALKPHADVVRPILFATLLDEREIFLLKTGIERRGARLFEHASLLLDASGSHSRIVGPFSGASLLDHHFRIIESRTMVRPKESR